MSSLNPSSRIRRVLPQPGPIREPQYQILACVLLMQHVLPYYESLSDHHPRSAAVASPPPSADSYASSSPFYSSHGVHAGEPVRIGDFEVECSTSRQLILDAVVTAQKQKARRAVSTLDEWAREPVEQGKMEGLLATAFLESVKLRLYDSHYNVNGSDHL
jgi:hypothetical protein